MEPILYALREYGTIETKSNPKIEEYIKSCKYSGNVTDQIPWCSGFVNWCAKKAGAQRSNSLSARSWLNVGKSVSTVKFGDVVVFWRGTKSGTQGHVGFFVSWNPDGTMNILGGNQSNSVSIQKYKVSQLLGYRRIY